jgi:hypothetical protein
MKLNLSNITSGYGAVAALNANFDAIEQAVENTLSRDGTTPNEMEANLDMNGNNILNADTINTASLVINGTPVQPSTGVTVASAFQSHSFVATAAQTSFSVAPFTPYSASVVVEVNGIVLPPADVSVSGTNVVIPACTVGDEVVIRRFTDAPSPFPDAEDISFNQAGTVATRSAQSKLRDVVDVRDYGASTTATATANATAINAAIQANLSGEIRIAETYSINSSINLNGFSGTIKFAGNGSGLKAGANNLKVFQSTTNAYGCRIIDARVDGNSYTGVYAFDLTRFQLDGAQIVRPVIVNCEYGIYLRSLCWGLKIENPDCALVNYPITLVEGCNAVLIDHPSIDTFGAAGIWIKTGGAYPNVGNMILNGFVQNGTEGIVDQGIQTQVVGTYLEGNSVADISLKTGSVYFYGGVTNHTAGGARAYRSSNADSAMIVHPVMSSGGRTIGLLDFDNTNTNCYYDAIFGAGSRNLPIGVTTGIQPISNKPGPIGGVTPSTGAFTTLSASGSASLMGGVNTGKGVVSAAASGAASTIFTIGAGNRGRYDIVAMIANSGAANLYTVFATVVWDGTGARIVANNTANMTITLSGSNVQATQSSGSANDIYWSYTLTSIV